MRITYTNRSNRWTAAVVALLLAAFALRAAYLDRRPLWWDEGLIAHLAYQSPAQVLGEMRITNHADPPFYPLIVSGWRALVGGSPFALRLFSAAAGTALVALTWAIGCWLAERRSALLAALLVALAPMQITYAREAKSYAFATFCALLSTYAWGRRLRYANGAGSERPAAGWWIVYVASTAAALGSHYYLGLLVAWQGVWTAGRAAVALVRQPRVRRQTVARAGQWLLAMAIVGMCLAPTTLLLFQTTLQGVTGVSRHPSLSLESFLGNVIREFGAGPERAGVDAWVAGGVLLLLCAAGILTARRRTLLATWLLVPLAAAFLLQTAYSFFFPRFLLFLGPPCCLLIAQAVFARHKSRLPAIAAAILATALIFLWVPGWLEAYAGSDDPDQDPRPAIAHIQAQAEPGDALVYVYIWQSGYLHSYYPDHPLTLYRAYYTPETVREELAAVTRTHPRLWLFSYQVAAEDPQNLSGTWLESEAYKVESVWCGVHHLALYLAPDFETPGVGPEEESAVYAGQIELHYPVIEAELAPGNAVALPLRWEALSPPREGYQVFVHLGTPGTPPLAQNDGPPQNGLSPTSTWAAGQGVTDRRVLRVPSDAPAGRYAVSAGLYRLSDGSRLLVDGSEGTDIVVLGYVEVIP